MEPSDQELGNTFRLYQSILKSLTSVFILQIYNQTNSLVREETPEEDIDDVDHIPNQLPYGSKASIGTENTVISETSVQGKYVW